LKGNLSDYTLLNTFNISFQPALFIGEDLIQVNDKLAQVLEAIRGGEKGA
jgi:hypothetical protein